MSKEVDLRIKELTHVIHRKLLTRSVEQMKTLIPLLISSISVCVTSKHTGRKLTDDEILHLVINFV